MIPAMRNHFVTGGAGFIGSHLVDRLIAEGKNVTVYDSLVSGKKEHIASHMGDKRFRFIQGDLLDLDRLKEAMVGHDLVWHLGANTDIVGGNQRTDLDLKNCTIATRNALEAMISARVVKMAFASSATVYGDAPVVPTSEQCGPLLPLSLYGAGKVACEALISAYCHLFGIQAWVFRFGNVVGGRMSHGVIFDFIHKLKNDPRELEILGDGNQEKPFFLVEDCIEGMMHALDKSNEWCSVFNLGCESCITVTDVARIVVKEMGLNGVKFKYTGGKRGWPGDVPVVGFDLGQIRKLGWEARYASDEAVRIATRRLLDQNVSQRC